ncbi:hypothetical protein BST12_15775 [Mycobacterium angelicum]|uniref:GTP cyclohydrolase 1 n=1 Tax=Mycobacterium angelicum TaxID=470074 RepID=A0A1W9ZQY3_MYCAN|nr:GTP cyclohydrolase I [Mycobacterium angelicum]ORA20224.1 hypothetical protein BST12_15775 [Mycobacterium angelicum]
MPQTASIPLLQFPLNRPAVADTELVLAPEVAFQSLCEHHLLPYNGVVHIGYLHGENLLGTTDLTRLVEACSGGIQDQQRMTTRIGLWLHHQLRSRGLGVLVEGDYTCAAGRGRFAGPKTTLACYGSLRHSATGQREFLTLARRELRKGRFGND